METGSTIQDRKRITVETTKPRRSSFLQWLDEILRRSVDIMWAGAWLVLLAPVFVLIGVAIRHDSPGPIFYRGKRVGKGGRVFGMLKFRTMYEREINGNGAMITARDDPRITPIGKWLRDNKLNELPQLWNVLTGDMSFVGPRPEDPEIVKGWPEEDKKVLLSVRPGITSPATIVYRDEEQLLNGSHVMEDYLTEILPTKLRLEQLYLRNRSIFTDLDVIFWTGITMLPKIRSEVVPQKYLFWGPVSRFTFRYLFWFIIDTLVAFMAVGFAGSIWRISGPLDIGLDRSLVYALMMGLFFSLTNWLLGLNRMEWSRAPANTVIKLAFSTGLAVVMIMVADNLLPLPKHLPEAMISLAGVVAFGGFTTVRYRERLVTGTGTKWLKARGGFRMMGERVLIVGGGENGALASYIFDNTSMGRASSVIGIVDDDPTKQGLCIGGYNVLGMTNDIHELVRTRDIGLIVYTIDNIEPQQRERILANCYNTGVKVIVLPDILDVLRKELKVIHSRKNGLYTQYPERDAAGMLDEIRSLLATDNIEAARDRLDEFRVQYTQK